MTCGTGASANDGLHHCPCMMFLPGELSFHSSLPVLRSRQISVGASGEGKLTWLLSTPLLVQTKTRSPTMSGEQFDALCGWTLSSRRMSYSQMMSASVASLYFSV